MKIDHSKVASGSFDGQAVWVCDLNITEINKKPLRKVPPTKCLVIPSSDPLNKGKTVYYSNSLLRAYSDKDKLTSKLIKVFDNTGYRSYAGNPLHIFDSYDECRLKWEELVRYHLERLKKEKEEISNLIDKEIDLYVGELS